MDMVEISNLAENNSHGVDISIMLNFERVKNGASKEWLQNHS